MVSRGYVVAPHFRVSNRIAARGDLIIVEFWGVRQTMEGSASPFGGMPNHP